MRERLQMLWSIKAIPGWILFIVVPLWSPAKRLYHTINLASIMDFVYHNIPVGNEILRWVEGHPTISVVLTMCVGLIWLFIVVMKTDSTKQVREELKPAKLVQGVQSLEWTGGTGPVTAILPPGSRPASANMTMPSTVGWTERADGFIQVTIAPTR